MPPSPIIENNIGNMPNINYNNMNQQNMNNLNNMDNMPNINQDMTIPYLDCKFALSKSQFNSTISVQVSPLHK